MFPFEIRKISCEIACADPEGDMGSALPWKITSYMGFYRNYPLDTPPPPPPPPWKKLPSPLEKVGPALKPLKIIVFFEKKHWTPSVKL